MPKLTSKQVEIRKLTESVIKLMAPGLDLILACGERISRLVEPHDHEYYPVEQTTTQNNEAKR